MAVCKKSGCLCPINYDEACCPDCLTPNPNYKGNDKKVEVVNKKENIIIHDGIGVLELRQLQDLQSFNRALNEEEFMLIVGVYKKAIDRLSNEAKQQGIDI